MFAQEKISSKKEIHKFQVDKSKYIGKKVKKLLEDLNLKIISVQLQSGNGSPNIITFRFNSKDEYVRMSNKNSKIKPSKIMIFIKEDDIITNKLFKEKNNDSISNIIVRKNMVEKNEDLLKDFLNLTVLKIISISEK